MFKFVLFRSRFSFCYFFHSNSQRSGIPMMLMGAGFWQVDTGLNPAQHLPGMLVAGPSQVHSVAGGILVSLEIDSPCS